LCDKPVTSVLGMAATRAAAALLLLSSAAGSAAAADFCAASSPPFFDARAYGARGDGSTLNTDPLALAVGAAAAASAAAGGARQRVLVSRGPEGGVFLSGQVALLSGVTMCVDAGATLLASSNVSHYPADQTAWVFLFARGTARIGVGGGGTIDGNLREWIGGFNEAFDQFVPRTWPGCSGECRPRLVAFHDSTDVDVANITFTGSPDWTFHLLNCTRVWVRDWTQHGDERWPNNDGIDIDSSSDVLLERSAIDTADDGVCIKGSTFPLGRVHNVTVRDCTVRSRSSAIKFGSNNGIPTSELLFERITVQDSNRGLALQARDGPCAGGWCIENVTFRDILVNGTRWWPFKWWGDGSAIYISTMLRTNVSGASSVRNITFENVVAVSQGASVLSGIAPGGRVKDVTLRNVSISIARWPNWNYTLAQGVFPNVEYDPADVPGLVPAGMGTPTRRRLDAMPGVYVEGVEGLVLDDVRVSFVGDMQPYWSSSTCVNTTHAGYPVTVVGGSCALPAGE
jgi:polygalacturonase